MPSLTERCCDIYPYVPDVLDSELFEGHAQQVLSNWQDNLLLLLRLDGSCFVRELQNNAHYQGFLDGFLKHFPRGPGSLSPPLQGDVAKRVLAVYVRLARWFNSLGASNESSESGVLAANSGAAVAESLERKGVITVAVLVDIAAIYCSPPGDLGSDLDGVVKDTVCTLFRVLSTPAKALSDVADSICTLLTDLCDQYEQIAVGERFGGGTSLLANDSVQQDGEEDEADYLFTDHVRMLSDIAHHLTCLVRSYPPAARALHCDGYSDTPQLLYTFARVYDTVINVIGVRLATKPPDFSNRPQISGAIKYIKFQFVTLAYNIFEALYFSLVTKDCAAYDYGEEPDVSAAASRMCDDVLWLLEHGHVDSPRQFLIDSPLVLDMELEWSLTSRLREMNRTFFHSEDERIDFVLMSLEHLKRFSSGCKSIHGTIGRRREQLGRCLNLVHSQDKLPEESATCTSEEEERYIHYTQLISQVQDIFPTLGEGYIEACLAEFDNNPESVIMHLLESDLPPKLAALDQKLPRIPLRITRTAVEKVTKLMAEVDVGNEEESFVRSRRNVFDNDEFDVFSKETLNLDKDRVFAGKRSGATADGLLDDKSFVTEQKEALLNTLYDDEYDDTYDSNDVRLGPVDLSAVGPDDVETEPSTTTPVRAEMELAEEVKSDELVEHLPDLVAAYLSNRDVFARSAAMRRSQERQQLRKNTGLSDEILEGWYIMFQRNPRKDDIIRRYTEASPQVQSVVSRTAYRKEQEGSGEESSETSDDGGRPATRTANATGHRGGGGPGGQASGRRSVGADTARERRVKDKNKASRANHARKKQRERKLNRGMGAGLPG